jgi:flagellar protein FlaG
MSNPITTTPPLPAGTGPGGRVGSQVSTPQPVAVDTQRQAVAAGGTSEPQQPSPAQQTEQSAQDLAQATRDISQYIQSVSRSLQISVDEDLGSTVITVLNADTEEVVRQIPSEEVLQIARFLAEQQAGADADAAVTGLLFNDQA